MISGIQRADVRCSEMSILAGEEEVGSRTIDEIDHLTPICGQHRRVVTERRSEGVDISSEGAVYPEGAVEF